MPLRAHLSSRVTANSQTPSQESPAASADLTTALTFDELISRTRARRADLSVVLNDEQRLGRVDRDQDGRYRLVCDAFTPEVVTALSRIGL
jgi:hypothetical protein